MNSIFISYSHKDAAWKEKLNTHLNVLVKEKYCTYWEDSQIELGTDWFGDIEKALGKAHIIILLVSTDFLGSDFIRREEVPRILERRDKEGAWVIPLVVRPCAWKLVPWLKAMQLFPKGGSPLSDMSDSNVDKALAELVERIASRINAAGGQQGDDHESGPGAFMALPPERISIAKLPVTGKDVFGREKELELLNKAWADSKIAMLTLVAWGGVGKSALVNRWLNLMAEKNYCGAARVYGWSFYSQGAQEGKQASADEFMQETLQWYGDPNPNDGSNVDKGRRLAALIRKEKTLLILDGMEPLQYPPGEIRGFEGLIKDPGLKTLVKDLAAANPGLVVITTRESVTDVQDKTGGQVQEIKLENLSIEAGAQLLQSLGVTGGERDLAEAVKEYGGHALALTLLGNYVGTVYDGDIRQRDKIPALTVDKKKGTHARRVMAAYESWWGETPELNILRLMGLFDRPVEKGAVDALIAQGLDPIAGITDRLTGLTEADRLYALANLRGAGLLAKPDPHQPGVLDCHPLVREHFGEKLRLENPEGWKAAHKRLYEYYKALPEKELPDTLEEMEPLFAAVAHGCAAGFPQEARADVFRQRILRGNEFYIMHKLGAFGSFLAAVSHFFQEPWSRPASGLTEADKAFVLSWAGFGLRALGRLHEATQPMKAGLEMRIKEKKWENAAIAAGNLSELHLTLGQVDQAVDYGRQAVEYADKSKDGFLKEALRTTLANALHQQGNLEEAETWFLEAEALQQKRQPEYKYLYSQRGFQFCDLLLGQGRYQEVLERAEHGIEIAQRNNWLLDVALDQLSLGRAYMLRTLAVEFGDFSNAETVLAQAVEGFRRAGRDDYLPRGLFARAELFRHQQKYEDAWADLNESEEIARLGDMRLYIADYHLEAARLCDAQGNTEKAQSHRDEAEKLIEEMNYGRRKIPVVLATKGRNATQGRNQKKKASFGQFKTPAA